MAVAIRPVAMLPLLLAPTLLSASWIEEPSSISAAAAKLAVPSQNIPVFKLDLDEPASTRWRSIAIEYKPHVADIVSYLDSVIPAWALPLIEQEAAKLLPYFSDYGEEMGSVAQVWGVSEGLIVMVNMLMQVEEVGLNCSNWNVTGPTRPDDPGCKAVDPEQKWCYCHAAHRAGALAGARDGHVTLFRRQPAAAEATDAARDGPGMCTSIVAQRTDGTLVLGRNMDWNLPPPMRKLLVDLDVYRGGKKLFRGTGAVGVSGMLNGMTYAPGSAVEEGGAAAEGGGAAAGSDAASAWAVSTDARGKGGKLLVNALQMLLKHSMTPTQHLRRVLETAPSFEAAVRAYSVGAQIDMNYLVLAGVAPGEGAVITRGREKALDVWRLDAGSPNGWYRLQTNYDHWNPVPSADDRRGPGTKLMDALGPQKVSSEAMWRVLRTYPVFNSHTDFAMVSVPKLGLYNTTVYMGGEH